MISRAAASRPAESPRPVQLARITLAVGAVLSAAAALGPGWVARAGVALAVVAGVVAYLYASSALRDQRRAAGDRLIARARAHGVALHTERTQNAEVLDVLAARVTAARESLASATAEVSSQRARSAALRADLRRVHAENTDLRLEIDDVQVQLSRAQETMAQQEAELFVLRAEAEDAAASAEVVDLPRRNRDDALGRAASAS